jgi:hypothetical protein
MGFLVTPKDFKIYKYFKNVCIGYDQLFNAILLGDPDETISSRAHKGKIRGSKGWGFLADILNYIDPGHTEDAVEWDEGTSKTDVPLNTHTITKEDK